MFERKKIEGVEWVESKNQIADVFTKNKVDMRIIKYVQKERERYKNEFYFWYFLFFRIKGFFFFFFL